jgi:hypothetical protein
MAAPCFIAYNAAMPTSAPPAHANVGTSLTRVVLQIVPSTTKKIRIVEWGYTFAVAPANNVRMELLDAGATYATGLTAHVSSGVAPYNDANGGTSTVQLGTALTGHGVINASAPSAVRPLAYQYENGLYFKQQFPLGREPEIAAGNACWVRVTTAASAVDVSTYVIWEE